MNSLVFVCFNTHTESLVDGPVIVIAAGYLGDLPNPSDADLELLKLLPEIRRIRAKEKAWLKQNLRRLKEKAKKKGIGKLNP